MTTFLAADGDGLVRMFLNVVEDLLTLVLEFGRICVMRQFEDVKDFLRTWRRLTMSESKRHNHCTTGETSVPRRKARITRTPTPYPTP